jgi:hypothetical protein
MSTNDAQRPSLERCLAQLDALERDPRTLTPGAWDMHQALVHCAQGIEFSLQGYPRMRAALFRVTIGRVVLARFLRRGAMSHDRTAPIPGAPSIPSGGSVAEGVSRLRAAIEAFRAHAGPHAPHFVYGSLTHAQYDAIHAMHIEDHLRA